MTIILSSMFFCLFFLVLFLSGKIGSVIVTFPLRVSIFSIDFSFIFDRMSIRGIGLVLLISGCVFLFSHVYMSGDINANRFILLLAGFVLSILILLVSNSIPLLLVGWDGLGVTSFLLIIYYDRKTNNRSGIITFGINRFGDAVLIGTIVYFIRHGMMSIGFYLGVFITVSYIIVAMTKRAQYPFSMWLPLAIDAPTPVSALVHRRTLVTAGLFLLARLRPESFNIYLLLIGGVTLCVGGFCAVFSSDLKKLIANSTLSNLGLMRFILSLSNKNLILFHLFSHALFKAGLFITAGAILMNRFGAQDSRRLFGGSKEIPLLSSLLRAFFVSSTGLFFLSTFFSKHQIALVSQVLSVNILVFIMIFVGVVLTTLYSLRFTFIIMRDKISLSVSRKVPSLVILSIGFLAVSSIFFGNFLGSSVLSSAFCFELPLNAIIVLRVLFFLSYSNRLSRNMGTSILQIDTIMDVITKAGSKIVLLQQTDIGYRSLESKGVILNFNKVRRLIVGIMSTRRVNIRFFLISGCLILLFM